ncbi:UPF0175 family protein [Nostoc sp. FACHB-190]|uniref:UPF0175 family protein n=1 Tax=Nostoc sp. FACHB-190 TaxID=2692838 RepID=UPI001684C316|nr:UPF0175 family protein [Nostoc sp. FACHB-190]MBD2299922.1 UPF0175 family protein [Nostoc sp. FACHB-190]
MQITIEIPDDIAHQLANTPDQLSRRALESLVVEAYRHRQISTAQVQRLLNLSSRLAADAFLKAYEAYQAYTLADLEQDLQALDLCVILD